MPASAHDVMNDFRRSLKKGAATHNGRVRRWERYRLEHNLNLRTIQPGRTFDALLPHYIPTYRALGKLDSNCAFVALNTERMLELNYATNIGLALLPKLDAQTCLLEQGLTLENFVTNFGVRVGSVKIKGRDSGAEERFRESLQSGPEHVVLPRAVEQALDGIMEGFRERVPGRKLVLVGVSMQSEFERMCALFPHFMRHFSYWMDLWAPLRSMAYQFRNFDADREVFLGICGYHDFLGPEFSREHQAPQAAVEILAALEGLMHSKNVNEVLTWTNIMEVEKYPGELHQCPKRRPKPPVCNSREFNHHASPPGRHTPCMRCGWCQEIFDERTTQPTPQPAPQPTSQPIGAPKILEDEYAPRKAPKWTMPMDGHCLPPLRFKGKCTSVDADGEECEKGSTGSFSLRLLRHVFSRPTPEVQQVGQNK
ncbi:hypothetical protein F4819DRAFT_428311 [Hypoxylon fuscum]|nr:hypothetical protein F4819DRAFT_428311 [Hypoxylon fuscum]